MTQVTAAFLADLDRRGITLALADDGNHLQIRGPRSAMTPEIKATLAEHRSEILATLKERAALHTAVRVGQRWVVRDGDPGPWPGLRQPGTELEVTAVVGGDTVGYRYLTPNRERGVMPIVDFRKRFRFQPKGETDAPQ